MEYNNLDINTNVDRFNLNMIGGNNDKISVTIPNGLNVTRNTNENKPIITNVLKGGFLLDDIFDNFFETKQKNIKKKRNKTKREITLKKRNKTKRRKNK